MMTSSNEKKEKLRLIFLPYLIIALSFIIVYNIFNWLLIVSNTNFLKEGVVEYWLPVILISILIFLFLRPRIHLLKINNDRGHMGLQILMLFAIAVPCIIFQNFIETSIGKLTQLNNTDEYFKKPVTKYYNLTNFYLDTAKSGTSFSSRTTGKYGQDLNLHLYKVIPVYKSVNDTSNGTCSFWIGTMYSKQVRSSLSDREIDEKFNDLEEDVKIEFKYTDFNSFQYLERLGNRDDRDDYYTAIRNSMIITQDEPVIFIRRTEPFEERNGNKLIWAIGAFLVLSGILLLFVIFTKLDEAAYLDLKKGINPRGDTFEFIFFLLPQKGFWATPVIVIINVTIFFLMVVSGLGFVDFQGEDLIDWGAVYTPNVSSGEWWRMLTGIFLHSGFMHIISNMAGLVIAGIILEPMIKSGRFLIIYIVAGLTGGIVSIWWHQNILTVGASGAIFGIYGLLAALIITNSQEKNFNKNFLWVILVYIAANLLFGLMGRVDNAAHIGGLLTGFLIGLLMNKILIKE